MNIYHHIEDYSRNREYVFTGDLVEDTIKIGSSGGFEGSFELMAIRESSPEFIP